MPAFSKCGICEHVFPGNEDPYNCPLCGAGIPHTHTVYPMVDSRGYLVHPSIIDNLRSLGLVSGDLTRDELLQVLETLRDGQD